MYLVYKHTTPSGKVYIGITRQTAESRWKRGLGYKSSPHFWSAICKYGWENITHEILQDGLTKEEACECEKRYIAKYKATDREYGYNQKTGGEIGVVFNYEIRQKISHGEKEFYRQHPEAKLKLAERATGYKHSDEAKQRMRAARIGTHFRMSEEWKTHIGEANHSRLCNDETLYTATVERCRKNGMAYARRVEQVGADGNVIQVFDSIKAAGRITGIRDGNISLCCSGKRKSTGGYTWRYAIE